MRTPREVAKTGSDAGSLPRRAIQQAAHIAAGLEPAGLLEQLAQRDAATRLVVPLGKVTRDRIVEAGDFPFGARYTNRHGRDWARHQRGRQQGVRIVGEEITLHDERPAIQD